MTEAVDHPSNLRAFRERLHNAMAFRWFWLLLWLEARRNVEFDRRHGTDTASEIHLSAAGLSAQAATKANEVYRPTWDWCFKAALSSIAIDYSRFKFVDIGSGKGKLLLLASDQPFQKIIGIELAPGLHNIAVRNAAVYRSLRQRCHAIEAHLADATTFELPPGPLVCMTVNAFDQETMRTVLHNIEMHCDEGDREVYLIYVNMRRVSEMERAFDKLTRLKPILRRQRHIVFANAAAQRVLAKSK